jgi:hypothetical protein
MKFKFTLQGAEDSVAVESDDLKDLVYKTEKEILRIASERGSQVKYRQFLVSAICEALCRDANNTEIDMGELGE